MGGALEGWDLQKGDPINYDPASGIWSIEDVPNGQYRLFINIIAPNNGSAMGTSQVVTVANADVAVGNTVIAESGMFRGAFGLCGGQTGDDVAHFVKNVGTGAVTQLEYGQSGWGQPSTLCPPEVSYGNYGLPDGGIPAGTYIAYTVWNGDTYYYAGDSVVAAADVANAKPITVQNWAGSNAISFVVPQLVAGEVAVDGIAKVGQVLTAAATGWTAGATFSYQWLRDDEPINGATEQTYALTSADAGAQFSVTVTGAKTGFEQVAKTSARTAKVAKAAYVPLETSPFNDVATDYKFYDAISWMYTEGLSTGVKTSTGRDYQPKVGVSREAMAAFLYRLEGSTFEGPEISPFDDVKPGDKFYNEIAWMRSGGLSTGVKTSSGRDFQPKAKVSREAMAAFIYRLENASAKGLKVSPFADVKSGDKFYSEIAWMAAEGLSNGIQQPTGKPFYAPKDQVSREAMAAFLYRLKG